ncbi:MAG: hypothetical protein HYV47_03795 [Candidatus Nealsonbacteria bacterium]|nr:hypothetical protein [Candidatus Nealsonbacteria bacterium]
MGRCYFSVEYNHPEHPDNICAVDWDCWAKGRWVRSWRSDFQWHKEDEDGGHVGKLGFQAIVDKFGLNGLDHELTPENIEFMSPARLMAFRRQKGLPYRTILSDTLGDPSPAEEYD